MSEHCDWCQQPFRDDAIVEIDHLRMHANQNIVLHMNGEEIRTVVGCENEYRLYCRHIREQGEAEIAKGRTMPQ